MFYAEGKLRYPVRVDKPNPRFAKMLRQAWNARGPKNHCDMLLATGTEEMAHIELLATAIAPQIARPFGDEPRLTPAKPGAGAQTEQMTGPDGAVGRLTHAVEDN